MKSATVIDDHPIRHPGYDRIGPGPGLQAMADALDISRRIAADPLSALKKRLGVDGVNGLMKSALDSGV